MHRSRHRVPLLARRVPTVVVLAYAKAGYRAPALFDAVAAAILELKEDMTVSAAREQGRRC